MTLTSQHSGHHSGLGLAPSYRGSVKDVLGPVQVTVGAEGAAATQPVTVQAAIFEYTDAYSVFDWGRMPDVLDRKGQALAVLAAFWFEKLSRPETWREFSKSHEALSLRKGSRFGSAFNEIGEQLQARGLHTHYLGVLPDGSDLLKGAAPLNLAQATSPMRHLLVRNVSVVRPSMATVLGRALPDYHLTRNAPAPRLIPLEVVFRFSCPEGSSLLERVKRDPGYLAMIGFPEVSIPPGAAAGNVLWEFPVIELFTKLENSDRPVGLSEALAISGLTAAQLQDMLLRTAWVAGLLKWICAASGLELADGKLEWALTESGECMLVDAIGPDELRLIVSGVQLSKEFLRSFYRGSTWYAEVEAAKSRGKIRGTDDWKKLVKDKPPTLPPLYSEIATQLYWVLANAMTGRTWFPDAWSLSQLAETIQKFGQSARLSGEGAK